MKGNPSSLPESRSRRAAAAAIGVLLLLAACSPAPAEPAAQPGVSTSTAGGSPPTSKEPAGPSPTPTATRRAIATRTPEPAVTPTGAEPAFDETIALDSGPIPEEIISELRYFGAGGGPPEGYEEFCYLYDRESLSIPYIFIQNELDLYKSLGDKNSLYYAVVIVSCGWQPDESVRLTVTLPGGGTYIDERQAEAETTAAAFLIEPTLQDQPGLYTVILAGESGELTDEYELIDQDYPGMTVLPEYALLFNFAPHEQVRIYAYKTDKQGHSYSFLGGQVVKVNGEGKLDLSIPKALRQNVYFTAVGEQSGTVQRRKDLRTCPRTLPPVAGIGSRLETVVQSIPFVSKLSDFDHVVMEVPKKVFIPFTPLTIEDGPLCVNDNMVFWLARFEDGSSGWIAESINSYIPVYYLLPPEQAEAVRDRQCPGAPFQRMQIGASGHVCTQSATLALREDPSSQAQVLERLETDTFFNVLDGPVCADGRSWWQVKIFSSNTTGWLAEGGDAVDPYFICP